MAPAPTQVACYGHQELRDMVIELRADVKHIDERISDLVAVAQKNDTRIRDLETYRNQADGMAKGVRVSAALVSTVISVAISLVAIAVTLVVYHVI